MADEIEQLEKTKFREAIEEQDEQNQPWDGMERRSGEDRRQSSRSTRCVVIFVLDLADTFLVPLVALGGVERDAYLPDIDEGEAPVANPPSDQTAEVLGVAREPAGHEVRSGRDRQGQRLERPLQSAVRRRA